MLYKLQSTCDLSAGLLVALVEFNKYFLIVFYGKWAKLKRDP
jgi:hypothetical protein